MRILSERCKPFFHTGSDNGCLLIHGFPGTPHEMKWLGVQLASAGYSTLGVRLFGHGTRPEDLTRARWEDWVASVEDGYHLLRGVASNIVPIGLSMGGMLALLLSQGHAVRAAVVMDTPYQVPDPRLPLLRPIIPLLSAFWKFTPTPNLDDWHDPQARQENPAYERIAVRAAAELHDLFKGGHEAIPEIQVPILLLYSTSETTKPEDAYSFLKHLGSTHIQTHWIEGTGHNLPSDSGREQVLQHILSFLEAGGPKNSR